jgi:two-component system sensor histidine kinase MprB
MSFRARIALVSAAAVALAIVVASIVVYFVVRDQLVGSVDDGLRARAKVFVNIPADAVLQGFGPPPEAPFGGAGGYPQLVSASGQTARPAGASSPLPVSEGTLDVARGERGDYYSEATIGGTHLRLLTFRYADGYAMQLARPLTEVDHSLSRIRWFLILIAAGGSAVAAGLGLLVSRAALTPVRRLTRATEHVSETLDLSERIEARGEDELSRLAGSFNTMLGALDDSRRVQRQLIEDASHELRTPLTSLRTNVEVLASERALPPGERERLLSDVVEQLHELSVLVGELLVLARGEQHGEEPQDVRLDLLAEEAVERARRNRPGVTFTTELDATVVSGVPATIDRAVGNLLDNAAKWSPPGGEVKLEVRDGTVIVRDHGPGIADEDLPHVFERFYRAKDARGMPGSGLGLAIVRQVAEAHGGGVELARANGGGTVATLTFPTEGIVEGVAEPVSTS